MHKFVILKKNNYIQEDLLVLSYKKRREGDTSILICIQEFIFGYSYVL
jgi:hypothetical protein